MIIPQIMKTYILQGQFNIELPCTVVKISLDNSGRFYVVGIQTRQFTMIDMQGKMC